MLGGPSAQVLTLMLVNLSSPYRNQNVSATMRSERVLQLYGMEV